MQIEQIKSMKIMKEIEETCLRACIEKGWVYSKRYKKGATVHEQGEACHTLDLVLLGELVAYALNENGSALTLFEFKKGRMIGANLLFGDSHEYPLNIYCLSECELVHIEKEAVRQFLSNEHFMMAYIKSLSINSQGMNRKITMLTQKSLRENILDYIRKEAILQQTTEITLPMTKREWADYLGVQRPSLFRELKSLKDEKVIEIQNRTIKLL